MFCCSQLLSCTVQHTGLTMFIDKLNVPKIITLDSKINYIDVNRLYVVGPENVMNHRI